MKIRNFRCFACRLFLTLALLHVSALCPEAAVPDFGQSVSPAEMTLPATGKQEAVVEVSACGKYAVVAKSAQGTALQLIDRMAGPGRKFGQAGVEDGRIDAILDRGTYKIVTYSHTKGSGDVTLSTHAFEEQNAPLPPRLVELKPIEAVLDDFQQRSYWLEIKKARYVTIEAAGRNLSDLRLWKDGNWLLDAEPSVHTLEPVSGKPLATRRLGLKLNPGLYLLTAYGGPSQPWSESSDDHPLYIRYGIPSLPEAMRQRFTASPFGLDRWLVPKNTNYFRLELPEAESAEIRVARYLDDDLFGENGRSAEISKKSLPPVTELTSNSDSWQVVTIVREPGKAYTLKHFESKQSYQFDGSSSYWLSTIHSGHGEDSVDATAMLTAYHKNSSRKRDERLVKAGAIEIGAEQMYHRRFNLLDSLTLFLEVTAPGKYLIKGSGADARFVIEPFLTFRPEDYKRPRLQRSGYLWDLDKGFYVLTVNPEKKGILDLDIHYTKGLVSKIAPTATKQMFQQVNLKSNMIYTMYLNQQPGVKSGLVLRKLPIDLEDALPVTQNPGETLEIDVQIPETGELQAIKEDGGLLPFSVNNGDTQDVHTVKEGHYRVRVLNSDTQIVNYSLSFSAQRLAVDAPLPKLSAWALLKIPNFPSLTAERTEFFDIVRKARETFLVQVEEPALYRLETTGLLQTAGNLRTRTITSFDSKSANGVGRNFLIQQYLREGDYQLTMGPEGKTAGHLGLKLSPVPMREDGVLHEGVPARFSLAAGEGLLYRFSIPEHKTYRLRALGLKQGLTMRLEDEDGWPLVTPGMKADLTTDFRPGNYRLVILPQAVESRVITLLEAMPEPVVFTGHGPHVIPNDSIGETIEYVWMEPEEDGERTPDRWRFHVPAPVHATLYLSSEMMGVLQGPGENFPLRLPLDGNWSGTLERGEYTLEAKSLFPNNRLDYSLKIAYSELTEGHSRQVSAPADIPISIGEQGPIEIASFGSTDVRGRLYDAKGRLVRQNDDRPADWNFYLAGNLTPGRYRLRVDPVEKDRAGTTIMLGRPVEIQEAELALPANLTLEDTDLHTFPLQPPSSESAQTDAEAAGTVLLASARSDAEVWMALEQERNGIWNSLGEATGRTPLLAVALDRMRDKASYRIRIQSADRRSTSIGFQAFTMQPPLIQEEQLRQGVTLPPIAGLETPANLIAVELQRPGFFQLEGEFSKSLAWAGAGGQQLSAQGERLMLAQGKTLWLLDTPSDKAIRAKRVLLDDERILTMTLPAGLQPTVELEAHSGPVLVVAESRLGQPGIAPASQTYHPELTGIAPGSAATVIEDAHSGGARLLNAGDPESGLILNVERHAFEAPVVEGANWGMTQLACKPESARVLRLPPGLKQIQLALPPQTAALIGQQGAPLDLHWSGDESLVTSVENAGDSLMLLYAGGDDGYASVTLNPLEKRENFDSLDNSRIFNRYLSTSGIFRLKVELSAEEKRTGVHLQLRGTDAGGTFLSESGLVQSGSDLLLNESGIVDIAHAPGPLLAWLEGGESDPWLETEQIVPCAPPEQLSLRGASVTLRVENEMSSMLHLDAGAPVIARVYTGDHAGPVEVHPNGGHLEFCLPFVPEGSRITLRAIGTQQLAGSIKSYATEILALEDGMGPEFRLGPGDSRLFRFTLWDDRAIGIGVSGSADIANCRLLDSGGRTVGTGVVQMHNLTKGEYFLSVDLPDGAASVELRPVLVGLKKPEGPPPDVIRRYLEQAGLKQEGGE